MVKKKLELHVSCIAKIDSGLIGTFVASHLKTDDGLPSLELLFWECPFVLLSFFWSDTWFAVVTSLEIGILRQPPLLNFILHLTFLPNDCKQITTELRFCLSQRSTVWNVSCGGTPSCLAASKNALMFSMHLKAIALLFTFFTKPGCMLLTNLKTIILIFMAFWHMCCFSKAEQIFFW